MRKFAGWTTSSKMLEIYIHLTSDDVNKARYELEMGETSQEKTKSKKNILMPVICPRCNDKNLSTNKYCSKCWMPLGNEAIDSDIKILNTFRSAYIKKVVGIDIDNYVKEYYNCKNIVEEMSHFYKAFNGNKNIDISSLRQKLGRYKSKFDNLMEYLLDRGLISINKIGEVEIVVPSEETTVFDNFIKIERRYLLQEK